MGGIIGIIGLMERVASQMSYHYMDGCLQVATVAGRSVAKPIVSRCFLAATLHFAKSEWSACFKECWNGCCQVATVDGCSVAKPVVSLR